MTLISDFVICAAAAAGLPSPTRALAIGRPVDAIVNRPHAGSIPLRFHLAGRSHAGPRGPRGILAIRTGFYQYAGNTTSYACHIIL